MAAASKPESEPLLVGVDLEKKRAAAVAYWKDRKMIIGMAVYVLISTCVVLMLSIMIYIEKQKPYVPVPGVAKTRGSTFMGRTA